MKTRRSHALLIGVGASIVAAVSVAATTIWAAEPPVPPWFIWTTVVNNDDKMPGAPGERTFNSYNQPSVNVDGLVVIRARSTGGPPFGPATHGIYTRDMVVPASPIVRVLDRTAQVPQPNNAHYPPANPLLTTFVETPSFPRIDMLSDTIATRGNHQPVWEYTVDEEHTRAGTTGIYTNPFGDLITGASKLGAVPGFGFFAVPGLDPPTMFDVFPGAPAVTDADTIVFKGNYTVGDAGKTGVFYRILEPQSIVLSGGTSLALSGGESPVVLIANNTDTLIPGTSQVFGSTSPPSAANGHVVFAGFDNEESPTLGGIYLAPLTPYPSGGQPDLTTLVSIGGRVPGEDVNSTFNGLGEGGAFDGRYVGFWGSWGTKTRTVRLYCPTEGNKDRIAYCNRKLVCEDGTTTEADPNSVCDDETDPNFGKRCYQEKQVPVNQGIFVHDLLADKTYLASRAAADFADFVFWGYSGRVPGSGTDTDAEPPRWRSATFLAVSDGLVVFKARTGYLDKKNAYFNPIDGLYLADPATNEPLEAVAVTGMDGAYFDSQLTPGTMPVTAVGIEREGFRGDRLVITLTMANEEEGWGGIYLTTVRGQQPQKVVPELEKRVAPSLRKAAVR
jgi:hypothetical protein